MEINGDIRVTAQEVTTKEVSAKEISQKEVSQKEVQPKLPETEVPSEELRGGAVKTSDKAQGQVQAQVQARINQAPSAGNIMEALKLLGFKPTQENAGLASLLVLNGMPVTTETLKDFIRAFKLTGNPEQALFLMKNELPVNTKNAEIIKSLAENKVSVMESVKDIVSQVENLPEGPLKDKLTAMLTGKPVANSANDNQAVVSNENGHISESLPGNADTIVSNTEAKPVVQDQPTVTVPENKTEAVIEVNGQKQETVITDAAAVKSDIIDSNVIKPPAGQEQKIVDTALKEQPDETGAVPKDVQNQADNAKTLDNGSSVDTFTAGEIIKGAAERIVNPKNSDNNPDNNLDKSIERGHVSKTVLAEENLSDDEAIIGQDGAKAQSAVNKAQKSELMEKVMDKFSLDPEKHELSEIDRRLNSLKEALHGIKEELAKDGSQPSIKESAEKLDRTLDFFNDAKNLVFMHLPVSIQGQDKDAGLYIFNHKKHKGNTKKTQSALIALDTESLGRFETYIQRNGDSVNFRFTLEEKTKELVQGSIEILSNKLRNKGFRLEAWSFAEENEPFTPLYPEPVIGEEKKRDMKNGKFINLDVKA